MGLRVPFGADVFPHELLHKLAHRSVHCMFIGYASNYKGYRCLKPILGGVYTSKHVNFF